MNDTKTILRIPYLSASRMDKVLELVSERSLSNIESSYFEKYGFSKTDSYLAVNTLKFLGLIDEHDKSTDLLRKFQLKGDIRNKEIQEIIKSSYKDLFGAVNEPYKLSKDDLTNEFMHHYSLSNRVAGSAVPAFLKLCEFSGFLEPGSVLTRKRINKPEENKSVSSKKNNLLQDINQNINLKMDQVNIPVGNGETGWWLPSKLLTKVAFDGKIAEDIKSVTDKISEFEKKYYNSGNLLENNNQTQEN